MRAARRGSPAALLPSGTPDAGSTGRLATTAPPPTRPESEDQEFADLVRDPDTGRWSVAFSDEGARRLSTLASGASELAFALYRPGRVRGLFCASRSTTWPDASPLTRSAGRTRKPGTGQRESIPRTPRRGEAYARRRPGYRRSSTPSGEPRKMSASRTTPSTRSSTSSTWPTGTPSRSSSRLGHRGTCSVAEPAARTTRLAWRHSVQGGPSPPWTGEGDGPLPCSPTIRFVWPGTAHLLPQIEGWLTQRC